MKQYIFLLFSLFLAACAEKDISGVDGPTGPNSGLRLSVRLSSGVATRALGDPFASGKEEKLPAMRWEKRFRILPLS